MSTPVSIMASDPNTGIIRRIIELRVAYEKVCSAPPTHLYVGDLLSEILRERGFKDGAQVAGLKIIHCPILPENEALCSRSDRLFVVPTIRKAKK